MANYRKFKVNEVGTDTYVDYEANVSQRSSERRWASEWKKHMSLSSIKESLVLVLSIQVSIFRPTRLNKAPTALFSSGEDLCAISYDNGNIRLYSTYDNHLKLVKGQSERTSDWILLFLSDELGEGTLAVDRNSP